MKIDCLVSSVLLLLEVVVTSYASESRHTSNWAVLVRKKYASFIIRDVLLNLPGVGMCVSLLVQLSTRGEHAFNIQEREASGHTGQVRKTIGEI